MIPAIILFCGMTFLPESPRWLGRHDRWDEARNVLTLVHGKGNPDAPFVITELKQIRDQIEFERSNADVTYLELFKPNMINRTHIGIFTQIWSQLTGMNVMMYYITYVFTMAGLTGSTLLVSSSIQYVINVVMTVPALLYVDRWGRRPTLLIGAALMAIWLFTNAGLLGGYGHYAGPKGVDNTPAASTSITGAPSKAVIACSYLFVASYAPTWGPVSWIYPPELYPLRVRGKAVALATSANWAFNFALGYFVPPAFVNIQWKTYLGESDHLFLQTTARDSQNHLDFKGRLLICTCLVFGVFCICMFVHVLFMFPETAGKTLEEVELIFTDPNGIPRIGTPAWKTRVDRKRTLDVERHGSVATEGSEETKVGYGQGEERVERGSDEIGKY
jgi:sugar porter (SP) family MFS transporter